MMVHRLLALYLSGADSQKKDYYEGQCKHASEREIIAAEAERSSIKYKLVEFMQDKVGYEFEGHISGLTEWGMYVEIEPTKIEGMVALRDITSDYFEFDQDRYRIVGKRSKVVYNLGDAVRIRVKKANLDQKLLDFELVETGNEERIGKDGDAGEEHPYFGEEHPYSGEEQTDSGKDQSRASGKNARKEKIRKAIRESKRKASKSGKSKDGRTSGKSASGKKKDSRPSGKSREGRPSGKKK